MQLEIVPGEKRRRLVVSGVAFSARRGHRCDPDIPHVRVCHQEERASGTAGQKYRGCLCRGQFSVGEGSDSKCAVSGGGE